MTLEISDNLIPPTPRTPGRRPPRPRSGFLTLIGDYNPFYFISAACMLLGCLMLTNSLSWDPIAVRRLLTLIVTLNVYEIALIGLALYLMKYRGMRRDGTMLLVLEAFFLVDVTFLNAEIVTAHFPVGVIVNVVLLLLALAKLGAVVFVLRPSIKPAQAIFIVIQLVVLFALPCVFQAISSGYVVAPRAFYVAWWVVGLMPALYEILDRLLRLRHRFRVNLIGFVQHHGAPISLYVALPYFAMALHLAILHYVYDATFFGADAAPVLIGLAFVMHRMSSLSEAIRQQLLLLRTALPIAAIVVSYNCPSALTFSILGHQETTLKLAIDVAYLAFVYLMVPRQAIYFIVAGAAAKLAFAFAPGPSSVFSFMSRAMAKLVELLKMLTPQTPAQWGVVAVAASFAFLVLGAAISILKSSPKEGSISQKQPAPPVEAGRAVS